MGLPLILAGLQVAGGVAGAVQGHNTRQKVKREIGRAYELGRERLNLRQGDIRQGTGESLVARGLAQGGNVRLGRAAVPTNATEVRAATNANRHINRFVRQQRGPQQTPVTAVAVPSAVPAVSVRGARDLGGQVALDLAREQQLEQNALKQQRDAAFSGANADATNALVGGIGQAIAGGIQGYQSGQMYNAAFGIDPVRPLERGAWAMPSVDALNIYNQRG